jgi:hypothetical protein
MLEMPRTRRPKSTIELQTSAPEYPLDRLAAAGSQRTDGRRRSSPSLVDFARAIIEVEQSKGLLVHPESPTQH